MFLRGVNRTQWTLPAEPGDRDPGAVPPAETAVPGANRVRGQFPLAAHPPGF